MNVHFLKYAKLPPLIFCMFMAINAASAQVSDSTVYPVVVQFNSVCCGVPSDLPLRNFISNFRKKNKVKQIAAVKIGPMGREGEYWLAFSLKELTRKQATLFKKQIIPVVEKLKDKGSATYLENSAVAKAELPDKTKSRKIVF